MRNLLINFGCSFTYGEGLEYHLWQDFYPNIFSLYKNKTKYFPCNILNESVNEFIEYREKNRYNGILKESLDLSLVGRSKNGGANFNNLEDLEILIKHLNIEKNLVPKYCVFQITNWVRDFIEFCSHPNDIGINDPGIRWIGLEKKKLLAEKVNFLDNLKKRDEVNELIVDVFFILLKKLIEKFEELEEMGCKCIFFIGLDDQYSYHLIEEHLKLNKYYLPIIFNKREYRSWDNMNRECYLTLNQNIGVRDDHPCLDSHRWLADYLHKKYYELL